ncbi:MAG TPA: Rne/Rng family ribonuclease, partial [Acetobacteraceae bacterium]|nr:Rne/Rng family ribonuclease [Acetobacteraceae bacterium]
MTKRMLIDATHAEETRVVVLDGNRLENFDVETSTRRQLKGNIYLAKVIRVEPSLQAAFVEYGGNRHGFLAFGEIHPDYYQIPVADRQRLLEMQAEEARHEQEEEDRAAGEDAGAIGPVEAPPIATPPFLVTPPPSENGLPDSDPAHTAPEPADDPPPPRSAPLPDLAPAGRAEAADIDEIGVPEDAPAFAAQPAAIVAEVLREPGDADAMPAAEPDSEQPAEPSEIEQPGHAEPTGFASSLDTVIPDEVAGEDMLADAPAELPPPETVGGDNDGAEDSRERRMPPRFSRNYKIQEVIKRRQILLVQVVKEERGTKGAALTTYLSLAGRYCVLMPNSPRGGGISRKITSPADRRRLKEVMAELDLPPGMGLIVRTAGANRPKPEIKRDCEYLLRLWDDIREHTLRSIAPALIYEEANLIKRSIRDIYSRDVDELIVDGEEGWRAARDFMRMLMPSHAKKVQLWQEPQPLFARFGVDAQLDAMLTPIVQLRSGGYLVINQTEALVAIDVNSGRSTRERSIEETALRTNLEAAEEIARQLRLRDLAGLIVIDFIDMEQRKHNAQVERRLKDALKADRARIQVGQISHFGLLEMSRQRLRSSLAETSLVLCPHCAGTGHVRSTESAAIHVLRGIEEEAAKRRAAEVVVHVALPVAMYVLNHKRERLAEIEQRYAMHVTFLGDDAMMAPQFRIERVRAQIAADMPTVVRPDAGPAAEAGPQADMEEDEELPEETGEAEETEAEAPASEAEDEPAGAARAETGAEG